jgi:ABC-type transport system involved in resistance to organic solvents, periplasmic component
MVREIRDEHGKNDKRVINGRDDSDDKEFDSSRDGDLVYERERDLESSREVEEQDARRRELYADGSLGVFTTIALVCLVWGFCWLKEITSLRPPQYINVVFHEVAGLHNSAGVFVDGVRVGIVDKIEWQSRRRVVVKIRINSTGAVIPQQSKFVILTNGIVGAKFMEIQMPKECDGRVSEEAIANNSFVAGEDPVRPELAVNNIAMGLSDINMPQLRKNLEADRKRLAYAADQLTVLARHSTPVIDKVPQLQHEVIAFSRDTRRLTNKMDRFLSNPQLSSDLKETAEKAKETVAKLQDVMHELNITLGDKPLREDIIKALQQLNQATDRVQQSVAAVHEMAGDKELRMDVKDILAQAHGALDKVENLLNKPTFGVELKNTLVETRQAVHHVDLAARQLNQILGKRAPLFHMMVGRPGYVNDSDNKRLAEKGDDKKARIGSDTNSDTGRSDDIEERTDNSKHSDIKGDTRDNGIMESGTNPDIKSSDTIIDIKGDTK